MKFSEFPIAEGVNSTSKVVGLHDGENVRFTDEQILEMSDAVPQSKVGAPNGVAALGVDGKVPADQLPNIGGSITIDPTPTQGSDNAVSSGGVFTILKTKYTKDPNTADLRDFNGFDNSFNNDMTPIINAAITQLLNNGGGTLDAPLGEYAIAGALNTTDGANAQIVFPNVLAGASMPRIKIRGLHPPNWASEVIADYPRNNLGVRFISTIIGTGSLPSVFGAGFTAQQFGSFNYSYVDYENIIIETRTKTGNTHIAPSMSGINGYNLVALTMKNVCVQTQSAPPDLLTPTGTFGVILPGVNNKAVVNVEKCKIEGFDVGIKIYEHLVGNDIIIDGCINGLELMQTHHGNAIGCIKLEGNKNNIIVNGNTNLSIQAYRTEHFTGNKFYDFEKDIKFISGLQNVMSIFDSRVVRSSVGYVNEFVKDPAVNVRIFNGAGENVEYGGGEPPTDPNLLLTEDWADLNGWTVESDSGAVIEVAQNGGINKLHMVKAGNYNNLKKNIVYTPGDQLEVVVQGTVLLGGASISILLTDGSNGYGSYGLAAGDSTHQIDTTGFPAGALGFLINDVSGEAYVGPVTVTKL